MLTVLEDHPDDPLVQELTAVIRALSEDEQIDLVTLAWIGRGDATIEGGFHAIRGILRIYIARHPERIERDQEMLTRCRGQIKVDYAP